MKKLFLGSIVCVLMLGLRPAHAQWAVIDNSVLAQSIQQVQQLKQQYDMLKSQYDAITGSYGVSLLENSSNAEEGRRVLPGTWQDVVNQQSSGALPGFYSERQDYFKNLLPAVDAKLFSQDPNNRNSVSYKLSTDNTQAAFAATEAIYNKIQDRMERIENLTKEIDKTQNVKNATDLNSRIAAENGFLNLDMQRLQTLQLSLQSTLQNNQNQASANHAEFFGQPMQ